MKGIAIIMGILISISLLTIGIIPMSVDAVGVDDDAILVFRDTWILIESDEDFETSDGVISGTGTVEDPYIIENWEIDGSISDYGIIIDTITKYCIIRNCDISYCNEISGEGCGIYLNDAPNIIIENCTIYECDVGIYLDDTYDTIIRNCYSTLNGDVGGGGGANPKTGIVISYSSNITICNNTYYDEDTKAIFSTHSDNCTIRDNIIEESGGFGIHMTQSDYFEIIGNYIKNGHKNGIVITNSDYNIIIENTIENNSYYAIVLDIYADYNMIYHNNIINNTNPQAWQNDIAGENNLWDNGEEGNYWNDWIIPDADGDGIVDIPYDIRSNLGVENEDRYPLTEPYTPPVTLTWSQAIVYLLIGILPFMIIILLFKSIFKTMEKETKK